MPASPRVALPADGLTPMNTAGVAVAAVLPLPEIDFQPRGR